MIAQLYRFGLILLAPITIAAALLHVVLGIVYAVLCFGWIGRAGRDAAVIAWSRLLLLIIGVRLESTGSPPQFGDQAGTVAWPDPGFLRRRWDLAGVLLVAVAIQRDQRVAAVVDQGDAVAR